MKMLKSLCTLLAISFCVITIAEGKNSVAQKRNVTKRHRLSGFISGTPILIQTKDSKESHKIQEKYLAEKYPGHSVTGVLATSIDGRSIITYTLEDANGVEEKVSFDVTEPSTEYARKNKHIVEAAKKQAKEEEEQIEKATKKQPH